MKFIVLCRKRKWGKKLADGTWVDIILFADNYWLVATDHKMLESMTKAWIHMLAKYGWETPTEELTWCTTQEDGEIAQIEINEKRTRRAEAKEGFKVLGAYVTFGNNNEVELENRLSRAHRAFWANWSLLGCVSVPLVKRLAILKATVGATLFWCAGSWNLRREQNERLRVTQMRFIRRMLRLKRESGEEMDKFLHRANGILRGKLEVLGIRFETWDIYATQLRFDWGGHVARLESLDPSRLTYRVLQPWDYGMIITRIADQNKWRQLHNRKIHIWRWGYMLYRHFGIKWKETALNREDWKSKVEVAKYKATKG